MNRRKSGLKLSLIVLSVSVAGLAAVYQLVYPITITDGTGYLFQIPPVFWVFVVLALTSLFFIAPLTESPAVTLGSVVAISLVFNFQYFLIYGVNGRDMRGEVSRLFFSLGKSHLGIDLYSYFQWPVHFVVIQQADRVMSLPLMDTIWVGYLAYYTLFSVAVGVFAYSFTNGKTFPWIAAGVFYIIFTRQWLNNQLVPQFIALVILIFLFSTHGIRDERLSVLRGALYIVLVLTHPFFFSFYVLYVICLPFVRGTLDSVAEVGTSDRPLYYQVLESFRYGHRTLIALQANFRQQLDVYWFGYVCFLAVSYLIFFVGRFVLFKERLFALLNAPMNQGSSRQIPARIMDLVFGTSRYGGPPIDAAAEKVLMWELVSGVVKDITLYGTISVMLALLAVSGLALVSKPSSRILPSGIGVVLAGGVYYLVGFVLPLLGNRAFQVFLLPLGTFLDGHPDHRKLLKTVVLIVLVASPVVVANYMANHSLEAGGNTHDYHGDEAGRFLLNYSDLERDGTVTYPAAGFPPYITKTGEDLPVATLEEVIVVADNGSETIVYGERQEYEAAHFDHRCNFDPTRRNSIYDNRIQILKDSFVSEPFVCSEQ